MILYPCNQFGKQEPAANSEEYINGVEKVRPGNGYSLNKRCITVMQKGDVNGNASQPIFDYFKRYCPYIEATKEFEKACAIDYEPKTPTDLRWNFEKFLIGADGYVVRRYSHKVNPAIIVADIERLLKISGNRSTHHPC